MNHATLAGILKGNREMVAAYKRAAAVFGEPMNLTANGSNSRTFTEFEAYANDDVWAEHATILSTRIHPLCEYGRPQSWGPQTWVWGSDFFTVNLTAAYPFNIYWHEFGCVDESGNRVRKAGLRPFAMALTVSGGRKVGLGNWGAKRDGLIEWAGRFANKKLGESLASAVADADAEIETWRGRIKEMASSAGVQP